MNKYRLSLCFRPIEPIGLYREMELVGQPRPGDTVWLVNDDAPLLVVAVDHIENSPAVGLEVVYDESEDWNWNDILPELHNEGWSNTCKDEGVTL